MRFRLQLITLDPAFATAAAIAFANVPGFVGCHVGDVVALPRKGTAFASPANSLGFMDGGIDYAYSRKMWPGCERDVRAAISDLGHMTQLGRPYLRVGSALWIPVGPEDDQSFLISAPTMFLPHDVSITQNAYWAMMAILMTMERIPSCKRLVCPSLCCGFGRMSVEESVAQMVTAVTDFQAGRRPTEVERPGAMYMILPSRDAEQPQCYDNREIGVGVRS